MNDVTTSNFGLLIAYILPGSVALWGIGELWPTAHAWFGDSTAQSPTVGGFLYVTLAAVGVGLFVSTVRWAIVDRIHHRTGIEQPRWDFAYLNSSLSAFELLVASHYRYYQFYANTFVAVGLTFCATVLAVQSVREHLILAVAGTAGVEIVLWLGSRDTLRKYYRRGEALMRNEAVDGIARPAVRSAEETGSRRHATRDNARLKIEGPFR